MSGLSMRAVVSTVALAGTLVLTAVHANAQQPAEIQITYSNQKFDPAEINAPADKAFTLRVKNAGPKAMEFESKTLKVEKVIAANSEAVINVRAQKAGRYEFFDEFNEKSKGYVNVK